MAMESKDHKRETIGTETQTVTVYINGSSSKATLSLLTEHGARGGKLRWRFSDHGQSGGERSLDLDTDVLGVEIRDKKIVLKAFEITQEDKSYWFSSSGEKKRAREDYVFEMETLEMATSWGRLISDCMASLGRPQKLLVLVNPFGGKKYGPKIFENDVKPLLEAAGIDFQMQETRYRLHATEIANSLDLTKYDGIVTVSGDGVVVEVLNGLLRRNDWEKAIKMPLGIIPGGTGNGMAKSLLHPVGDHCSASNATFAIIRGHKCPLDVASIEQGEKMLFSVLLLTWGFLSDVDIESEMFRWMGGFRIEFYALLRILNLRRYNGKIKFVPASGYEEFGDPVGDKKNETVLPLESSANDNGSKSDCYRGASTKFEASEWRFIDGPFVGVLIQNVPWGTEEAMSAPKAQFSDGCLDLIIVRDCPKTALLSLLFSMRYGSHVKSPFVTYLKTKALVLEPGPRAGEKELRGIIDMDGEVIARGDDATHDHQDPNFIDYGSPFVMKLDQGLATLFCPN